MSKRILFISNGTGEDRMACSLLREWKKVRPQDAIEAIALVGEGRFYQQENIPLLTPPHSLPSSGYSYLNPWLLWKDIRSGLLLHLYKAYRTLKALKGQVDVVIAVGDIVPVVAASLLQQPFVFIGCALSDYYLNNGKNTYDPLQLYLLRKYNALVFPRDTLTYQHLLKKKIQAIDAGNPMIDSVDNLDKWAYQPVATRPAIAVLPGSHEDAMDNFRHILSYFRGWTEETYTFFVIVSPHFDADRFHAALKESGWDNQGQYWFLSGLHLYLSPHWAFGNVIRQVQAGIGLAGTANEQLVAHGIPVISFQTGGKQYTHSFAEAQQRLLGRALTYLNPCSSQQLKETLRSVLIDRTYQEEVKQIGKERFGEKGASHRIVAHIVRAFSDRV